MIDSQTPAYNPQRGLQPARDSSGRLDSSLGRLQQSVSAPGHHNEQLERMADRLTGEVPTAASVTKLGAPAPGPHSLTHAIDIQLEILEQQLSRQQDALQRLGQL